MSDHWSREKGDCTNWRHEHRKSLGGKKKRKKRHYTEKAFRYQSFMRIEVQVSEQCKKDKDAGSEKKGDSGFLLSADLSKKQLLGSQPYFLFIEINIHCSVLLWFPGYHGFAFESFFVQAFLRYSSLFATNIS